MKRKYERPDVISEEFEATSEAGECCCGCPPGDPGLSSSVFAGNFSTSYCT
jgi:hypothetical protein